MFRYNETTTLYSIWYRYFFVQHSAEMAAIHQKARTQVTVLIKMYLQYSRTSIYRNTKKKMSAEPPQHRKRFNKGIPPKVSVGGHWQILRSLTKLWDTEGLFTSGNIATHTGFSDYLSRRTVQRVVNKERYFYLQVCKERVFTQNKWSFL